MAAPRRPKPEGFDENMARLMELQAQRAALDVEIDDLFVAVSEGGPTNTIAEMLGSQPSGVANRRAAALRRQILRNRAAQTTRAA